MPKEGLGASLVIPSDVISNIEKVEKNIINIADKSEIMGTKFISSMNGMSDSTLSLIERLQRIQDLMANLKIKGGGTRAINNDLNETSTTADRLADRVSSLAIAMNNFGNSGQNIAQLKRSIKELNDLISKGEGVDDRAMQDALVRRRDLLKQELELQDKLLKKEAERAKQNAKEYQKLNYTKNISVEGSLSFAESANTIARRTKAIEYLTEARRRLSTTDADYANKLKRLNEAISRMNTLNREAVGDTQRLSREHRKLMDTSDQLARKLALVFSVSQISGYVSQLVRVRGEFELQNKSLAAILQNQEKADVLYNRILDLAIQSPFNFKELNQYVKSLAAYQIEYEKLYDTTKMLADVSAGLGVDMQRLILAYGQVKAATKLRGTETRQFTEAGFNILGELSKYYTELEGRVVSLAEVQERQFKGMIKYEDVAEIFKRVTSEGGIFFDMQAKQADTLAGMMSNLRDKVDIMLNDIGVNNEGVIKGFVSLLGNIVANYKDVVNVVKYAAAGFLLYRIQVRATNDTLVRYASTIGIATRNNRQHLTTLQLFRVGLNRVISPLKKFGATMKAAFMNNIWLIAGGVLVDILSKAKAQYDAMNEAIDDAIKKYDQQTTTIDKIEQSYKNISDRIAKAREEQEGFISDADYGDMFAELEKLRSYLADEGYTVPINLELVNKENIEETFMESLNLARVASEFGKEVGIAIAKEMNRMEFRFLGINFAGSNLERDLKNFNDYANQIFGSAFESKLNAYEDRLGKFYDRLNDYAKGYYDELKEGRKAGESDIEWQRRRIQLLEKIYSTEAILTTKASKLDKSERKVVSEIYADLSNINFASSRAIKNYDKLSKEVERVTENIISSYGGTEALLKSMGNNLLPIYNEILSASQDIEASEITRNTFLDLIVKSFAAQGIEIDKVKLKQEAVSTAYRDFRDVVVESDVNKVFTEEIKTLTKIKDVEDMLRKKYKETQENLEVINRTNTKRYQLEKLLSEEKARASKLEGTELDASLIRQKDLENSIKAYDAQIKKEKELYNLTMESIKSIATATNLDYKDYDTKKDTSAEDSAKQAIKLLKEQISLIMKANSEYEKLRNTNYGVAEATEKVRDSFGDAFKGVGLEESFVLEMKFDKSGTAKSIRELSNMAKEEGEKIKNEALAPLMAQMELEIRVEGMNNLERNLQKLFSDYEISLDFSEAGIPSDVVKDFFGIDEKSLKDIESEYERMWLKLINEREMLLSSKENREPIVYETLKDVEAAGVLDSLLGKDEIEKLRKQGEQINEEFDKMLKDTVKRYAKYLMTTYSDYVKLKMKAAKDIEDVQNMKIPESDKKKITDAIKKSVEEDTATINWNEFKGSEEFVKIFSNLEYASVKALTTMRENLIKFKEEAQKLPISEFDIYMKKLEEVEDAIIERNPFKALVSSIKTEKELGYDKFSEEDLLDVQYKSGSFVEKYEEEIDAINTILSLRGKQISNENASVILSEREIQLNALSTEELKKQLELAKTKKSDAQTNYEWASKGLELTGDQRKAFNELNGTMAKVEEMAKLFSEAIVVGLEAAGVEIDESDKLVVNFVTNMVMMGLQSLQTALALQILGTAFNSALGPIGWVIMAIQLLIQLFTFITQIHDAKLQEKIDVEKDSIEELEKRYDDLKDAIESAYDIGKLKAYYNESKKNIDEQIASYERMIALEEDKKQKNEDDINDYKDSIIELEKERQELYEQFIEEQGGFGSAENMKSAAESFVDAWMEAYQETGNGLEALNEQFVEFFNDMVKKQMVMRGSEKFLQGFFNQFDAMFADGSVSMYEIENIKKLWERIAPEYNEFLTNIAEMFGVDAFKGVGDELSGLQKGIQGITEDTAQALEALLNSMRYFVADTNMAVRGVYDVLISADTRKNPMLNQLAQQTTILNNIYNTLSSVIRSGHSRFGGQFIKVEF